MLKSHMMLHVSDICNTSFVEPMTEDVMRYFSNAHF